MKRWIHAATDNQPAGGAHWERGSGDLAAFEWYIDNETEKLLGIIEEAWRDELGGYCAYACLGERRSDDKFLGKFDTRKEAERSIVNFYDGGSVMRGNKGDQYELVMESTDADYCEDAVDASTLSAPKDNLKKIAAPASKWEKSYESERGITFWSKDFDNCSADISDYDDDGSAGYEVRIDINGGEWNKENGGEVL